MRYLAMLALVLLVLAAAWFIAQQEPESTPNVRMVPGTGATADLVWAWVK